MAAILNFREAKPIEPLRPAELAMAGEAPARCPATGRPYELGHGHLPFEKQTANFIVERHRAADMPAPGECDPASGRLYETGTGAKTKTQQAKIFSGRA